PVRIDGARWDAGTLCLYKADGQSVRWTPGKAAPINDDSHTAPRPPEYADTRISVTAGNWYADSNHYDFQAHAYHVGRGLIYRSNDGGEQVYTLGSDQADPLKNITALALDSTNNKLWIGTGSSGLIGYDITKGAWERYSTLNSTIADD